jgi:hypothetical protein
MVRRNSEASTRPKGEVGRDGFSILKATLDILISVD